MELTKELKDKIDLYFKGLTEDELDYIEDKYFLCNKCNVNIWPMTDKLIMYTLTIIAYTFEYISKMLGNEDFIE